jgi:uncharacterized protein YraI
MKRVLSIAAFSVSFFAIARAFAADGYVTGNVNLRAGPDSSYPSVALVSAGSPVAVEGCIDDWSWCDVATADERGWMPGNFLQEEYRGERVRVPSYGVQIGIPIVSFAFGTYWDSYYRDRSWYGEREHWRHVRPRHQPASVRDGAYENSHEHSYGNRRGTAIDPQASHERDNRAGGDSRRSGYNATRAPREDAPLNPTEPQHPVAADVRSSNRYAHRAEPTEHTAVRTAMPDAATERATAQPRATADQRAARPKVIAEHEVATPRASRHEEPARSKPKQEDGKDKDNKDKDQR